MKRNSDIQQELNELGINLPEPRIQGEVPAGFFEQFSQDLVSNIHIEAFLSDLPKVQPYRVEMDYFDSLETNIQQAVFISDLPKENVYQVPLNYFDTLENEILKQINGNVVEMKPIRKTSGTFSFISIAASIIIILTVGLGLMNKTVKPSIEQQLAMLSDKEVNAYVANLGDDFGTEMMIENVDEKNLDFNSLEQEVFNSLNLENISTEELNKYTF